MKAKRALKRLSKIEAWMSDVTDRYLGTTPGVRKALQDAKAAVSRAREAVSAGSLSKTRTSTADAKAHQPVKKASPTRKRTTVKKAAIARAPIPKAPKESPPIKKGAKKRVARKTIPVPMKVAEAAAHEGMQADLTPAAPGNSAIGKFKDNDE